MRSPASPTSRSRRLGGRANRLQLANTADSASGGARATVIRDDGRALELDYARHRRGQRGVHGRTPLQRLVAPALGANTDCVTLSRCTSMQRWNPAPLPRSRIRSARHIRRRAPCLVPRRRKAARIPFRPRMVAASSAQAKLCPMKPTCSASCPMARRHRQRACSARGSRQRSSPTTGWEPKRLDPASSLAARWRLHPLAGRWQHTLRRSGRGPARPARHRLHGLQHHQRQCRAKPAGQLRHAFAHRVSAARSGTVRTALETCAECPPQRRQDTAS